jgi:hypothetical protein
LFFACSVFIHTHEAHKALPNEKKAEFIASFEKNKGTFAWVSYFTESTSNVSSEINETVDNFMNKFQILKLNGFSAKDFESDEESDRILQLLIQESEEANSYKSEAKLHPTEPKLNRYFYVFNKGIQKREGTEERNELSSSSDISKNQAKALMDAAAGKNVLAIKVENPSFLALREKCAALQSAKKVFQEQLNKLADTHAELKAKKLIQPHNGVAELLDGVADILAKGDDFLKQIREALPAAMHHSVDADEAKALLPSLEAIIAKALVHIDGMKMKHRQMKSFF